MDIDINTFVYEFEFSSDNSNYPIVGSILRANGVAVQQCSAAMSTLEVNPADVERLNNELRGASLPWLTVVENSEVKVGSARLRPQPVGE